MIILNLLIKVLLKYNLGGILCSNLKEEINFVCRKELAEIFDLKHKIVKGNLEGDTINRKLITDSVIKATIVLLLLMLFKELFGKENTLIGMIMGLAAVSLLNRNFTLRIKHRTITFILLNIILGISAYIANINVWIGFIINLLTITITIYIYE